MCVIIYWVGTPTAGIPTWDILNEVQAEIIKAASKVNIGYVNALCAEDFANVFGVQVRLDHWFGSPLYAMSMCAVVE